jgi:hypothetical protein
MGIGNDFIFSLFLEDMRSRPQMTDGDRVGALVHCGQVRVQTVRRMPTDNMSVGK